MFRRVLIGFRRLSAVRADVGVFRSRRHAASSWTCCSRSFTSNVATRSHVSSSTILNGIARSNRLMSTIIAQKSEAAPVIRKTEVMHSDLVELVASGGDERLCLVDVRDQREVEEEGAIPGSLNIPLGKLKVSLSLDDAEFEKNFLTPKPMTSDVNLIFYGRSSVKSLAALEISHKLGFKKSRHYPGGYEEWSRQNPS